MLIVFDLDGTLIDGYDGITDALGFALERLGFAPLPVEKVRGMVGQGLEKLLEKAVGAGLAPEGVRLFRQRYAVIADEKTRLMPDVPEVLERLAGAGHLLAVVSNKPAEFSRRILAGKGVATRFFAIAGPDAAAPPKPDPAMIRAVMRQAGAPPEETVAVGDMEIDAETARAAGCRCVLVDGGSRSSDELAAVPADVHLARLALLPDWVEQASGAATRLKTS
ncbi:MAG TPA: HAD family hydrolase [Thermoanaerobaculia bacterium]|jgi:phosphoglycolate phosphatase